jgi:hypothetical protein
MVDKDDMAENTRNYIPQNSGSSSGKSTGGCLIAIVAGILILLALYWGSK